MGGAVNASLDGQWWAFLLSTDIYWELKECEKECNVVQECEEVVGLNFNEFKLLQVSQLTESQLEVHTAGELVRVDDKPDEEGEPGELGRKGMNLSKLWYSCSMVREYAQQKQMTYYYSLHTSAVY